MNPKMYRIFRQFESRKQNLFDHLSQLSTAQLHYTPNEVSWSIIQVLDHLLTSETASLNYCRKKINAGDSLPKAGLFTSLKMEFYLMMLRSKIKFKAPMVVSNPSGSLSLIAMKQSHELQMNRLKDFIEAYPVKYVHKAIFKNPVIGRITLDQMVLFLDAHLQHHLYQINALLSKQSVNINVESTNQV